MHTKKILIIDDDKLVRDSIVKILEREGYKSLSAVDAFEAINKTRTEEFDLIISDIQMPGKNGIEAVREIQRLFRENAKREVPIIFITGYAEMSQEFRAERLGEVILKPFDLNHLLVTIREYL